MTAEDEVVRAARARGEALVRRDAEALLALMHPQLRWTTFRGEVMTREQYVRRNTEGELRWHAQRLQEPEVVVVGGTAVLVATVLDEVERDGERQHLSLRLTQVWVPAAAGGWLLLAAHAGPEVVSAG